MPLSEQVTVRMPAPDLDAASASKRRALARVPMLAAVLIVTLASVALAVLVALAGAGGSHPASGPVSTTASVWHKVACSSGVVALTLLGMSALVGLVQQLRPALPAQPWLTVPRMASAHSLLGVLAVVFTSVHLVATCLTPELGVGWLQLVVPFTRTAGPLAQACGVLAGYLLLAVAVTSGLRRVLSWRWWKRVHMAARPMFGLACLHSVLAETPAGSSRYLALCGSVMVVFGLLLALPRLYPGPNSDAVLVPTPRRRDRAASSAGSSSTSPAPLTADMGLRLLISQATWEAEGVMSVELRGAPGESLPEWRPGAHVRVMLPSGRVRSYSLCGDPRDRDRYRVAVLRNDNGRGGSLEFHQDVRVGTQLGVGPPRNNFGLVPAPNYLFLAGGIGIAAILPMVREAVGLGASWQLMYAGRSRARMAFLSELESLHPYRVQLLAEDEGGRPNLPLLIGSQPPGTAVYGCGPAAMLDKLRVLVDARPDLRLYTERFNGIPPVATRVDRPITVELRRSGQSVRVAGDRSVLDAVRGFVPELDGGCEQGSCGRCQVRVLAGEPDHRDDLLTEAQRAQGKMLICVSRAKGTRLTLDI